MQDSWKVTPRLLLTAGLRWDPFFPYTDSDGRVACFVPGAQSALPDCSVGMLFGGSHHDPGCPASSIYNNPKTSHRGWALPIGLQKMATRVFGAEPAITTKPQTRCLSRMWLAFLRLLLLLTLALVPDHPGLTWPIRTEPRAAWRIHFLDSLVRSIQLPALQFSPTVVSLQSDLRPSLPLTHGAVLEPDRGTRI